MDSLNPARARSGSPLDPAVERGIRAILHHDDPTNRDMEREAFGLQGQPDALPWLLRALRQRCAR